MDINSALDLSCVIPAYNEELAIEPVLLELFSCFENQSLRYEIIVVNNGSIDQTAQKLKTLELKIPQLKVLSFKENQGYGGGILAGLKQAQGNVIGFLAADGEVSAESLLTIYKKLKESGGGIAKAKRTKRQDGKQRKFFSITYRFLVNFFYQLNLQDVNGYPLLMQRSLFEKMILTKKNWMFNLQLLDQGNKLGAPISEVSITHQKRIAGTSKVAWHTAISMMMGLIFYFPESLFFKKR